MMKRKPLSVIGVILIAMAVGMVLQFVYYQIRFNDVVACLGDQFQQSAEVQQVRGGAAEKNTESVNRVITRIAKVGQLPTQEARAAEVADALSDFLTEQENIAKVRKANPFPDYPTGKCDT